MNNNFVQQNSVPMSGQQPNQPVNGGFGVPQVIPDMQPTNNFNQQFPNGQQNGFNQQFPNGQQNGFNQQFQNGQQNVFGQPMGQPNMTKEQFAQAPQLAGWKKNFKVTYIIGYICSALMLIGLYTVGPAALIDVGIVLGTTIGVHLKKAAPVRWRCLFIRLSTLL